MSPARDDGPATRSPVPEVSWDANEQANADPPLLRRVVVTGAAKGLGRLVLRALEGSCERVGIDHEPIEGDAARGVEHYVCDLTKRPAEDIFRQGGVDAVVHLAFEDDPRVGKHKRYNRNVLSTMKLLDHVARYDVKSVVVVSTAAVYGAHPHNPAFLAENAPLRALETYSGMRERVEADRYAQAWMWRHDHVRTTILRPTHVIGPTVMSPLKAYITRRRVVPVLFGFDPMMQLIHEDDLVQAIVLALRAGRTDIFNVSGPGEISLFGMLREVGVSPLPLPHPAAYVVMRQLERLRAVPFSSPMLDFLRYNLLVSDRRIRRELGFSPRVGLRDTLRSIALPRTGKYIAPGDGA